MDARKRQQNERKFGAWRELPTVRFYQKVYDGSGKLRGVHHKYPVDLGHQQATGDET